MRCPQAGPAAQGSSALGRVELLSQRHVPHCFACSTRARALSRSSGLTAKPRPRTWVYALRFRALGFS
jgi:hypothetical protein